MTRALVNQHSATMPGASHSDPWGGGHDVWKVGGKLFVVVGAQEGNGLNVKCPDIDTAQLLIEVGRALPAPYFHKSWVRIPFGTVDEAEMRDRISISYRVIRAGLSKKLQATLAPFPPS